LWGLQAILRSVLLSTAVTLFFVAEFNPIIFWASFRDASLRNQWLEFFTFNILSDYLSLFILRKWLLIGGTRPLLTLMLGPIVGAVVVLAIYIVAEVLVFAYQTQTFRIVYFGRV
jgi:hypothetical protein